MGRGWGYYDDDWYEPSRPLPADGIKAKGTYGASWWAKRWIKALESLGLGSRLTRGRAYARQGQVLNVDIEPGKINAKVQGSDPTPYKTSITIPTLTNQQWSKAIDAMAEQAIFAAKLLAGEMPGDIETAFEQAGVPLFPLSARELMVKCSCPDPSPVCKHAAAVCYLLGERFDTDPFLIFALRGRSSEQIIGALRARRVEASEEPEEKEDIAPSEPVAPLGELLATFYQAGPEIDAINIHIAAPEVDAAILKRLGAPPASTETDLKVLYGAMSRWVQDKAFGQE